MYKNTVISNNWFGILSYGHFEGTGKWDYLYLLSTCNGCIVCIIPIDIELTIDPAFFNQHGPRPCSIGKVVHHNHYKGIQQEYIRDDISSCTSVWSTLVRILFIWKSYVCYSFNMDIHPIHDTSKLSPHP